MDVNKSLSNVKGLIETAILFGGTKSKNQLIRTSQPIQEIHEMVKTALIKHGVNPVLIKPSLGESKGEMKLTGHLKTKKQDVCVINPSAEVYPQTLAGRYDLYGPEFTEQILSINIRSQLSSTAKNFDTLFERSFAESYNLHARCPRMVLGEVFMIAIRDYDQKSDNVVNFLTLNKQLEKYIRDYNLINNRNTIYGDLHRYEKVCLLLVDFSGELPKIYNSTEELIADGFLPKNSQVDMSQLSVQTFIPDLLKTYIYRFNKNIFLDI